MDPLHSPMGESAIADIVLRRRQVVDKFFDFKSSIQSKKLLLESTKQYMNYKRIVDELLVWMSDKLILVKETYNPDIGDNSVKMQKLQVMEAEITAHKEVILKISKICNEMKSEEHYNSDQAVALLDKVHANYAELLDQCKQCRGLVSSHLENEEILRNIDDMNTIIQTKFEAAQSPILGSDIDEVKLLSNNFKGFLQALIPERSRWEAIVKQTQSLRTTPQSDFQDILSKLDSVEVSWTQLDSAISDRKILLNAAQEVFGFISESNETQAWITEKEIAVSIEDGAKDLASSEALLRHHNLLERDLIAIEEKVKLLQIESTKLQEKYISYSDLLGESQADLIRHWEELRKLTEERGIKLSFSQRLQKFSRDSYDILAWISDIKQLINQDAEPETVLDAEALIERMQDYDGELFVREANIASTLQFGNTLVSTDLGSCEQVRIVLSEIKSSLVELKDILVERRNHLKKKLEILHFYRHCCRIKISLSKLNQDIDTNKTGNSWEETDGLMKELENIAHTFHAYCESFNQLKQEASRLLTESKNRNLIKADIGIVESLKDQVGLLINHYRNILLKIQTLHEYARQLFDVREWVKDKLIEVKQECTFDLERALQAHLILTNDIQLNAERIDNSIDSAKEIEIPLEYSSENFNNLISNLTFDWDELKRESMDKLKMLKDKIDFSNFTAEVDKIRSVLDGIEKQFNSLALGADFSNSCALKKSLLLLEHDIDSQKQRSENLTLILGNFDEAGNGNFKTMQSHISEISIRLNLLYSTFSEICSQIEKSTGIHTVLLEIDDEQEWIEEKRTLIQSCQITDNLISAQKINKYFEIIISDFYLHEKTIQTLSEEQNIDSLKYTPESFIDSISSLVTNWSELKRLMELRSKVLLENITIQNYFSKCADAVTWLKEKETLSTNSSYGKDEESVSLLLSQQVALLSDFDYFSSTISDLKLISDSIGQTLSMKEFPSCEPSLHQFVRCKFIYVSRRPQELSMEKGQIGLLLNSSNKDWWKVELYKKKIIGFVPANYLEFTQAPPDTLINSLQLSDPTSKQRELEIMYDKVLLLAQDRHNFLKEYQYRFSLIREINELLLWIHGAHAMSTTMNDIPIDLESAERLKSRFEELLNQVWSIESRILCLADLKDSSKLDKELNQDISSLLNEWDQLLGQMEERKHIICNQLDSQFLFNDIDDIFEWIQEIGILVFKNNLGKDLISVQLLLREHEMVENTRSAIQAKIDKVYTKSDLLEQTHPSSSNTVVIKKSDLDKAFLEFSHSLSNQSFQLESSHYYQRFLTEQRDLMSWVISLIELVSLGELSTEISSAEASLMQIEELKIEIDARETNFISIKSFGAELIQKDHYASSEISKRLSELKDTWNELISNYKARGNKMKDCLKLLFFFRDVDRTEFWIMNKKNLLSKFDTELTMEEVQNLLRNLNDFDKNLKIQESKLNSLQDNANNLINFRHYASAHIAEKRAQVLQSWNILKSLLILKRDEVSKTYSLQQFTLESSEFEVWITERKEIIDGKDFFNAPFNALEQYCQRHEALEAEVSGNEEKIRSILNHGQQLVDNYHCQGQFDAVSIRIASLENNWNSLLSAFEECHAELNHTRDRFDFIRCAKAILNWIDEVNLQIKSKEVAYEIESVDAHLDTLSLISVEIKTRNDQISRLKQHSEVLLAKYKIDSKIILEILHNLDERFGKLQETFKQCSFVLNQQCIITEYLRKLSQEDTWLFENILSASVEDYGKDLIGVQRLIKKQQRSDIELKSRHTRIINTLKNGKDIIPLNFPKNLRIDLEEKSQQVEQNLLEIKAVYSKRAKLLSESESYRIFSANVEEEDIWLDERLAAVQAQSSTEAISEINQILCKLEAYSSDFAVHQKWIRELCIKGNHLIEDENLHSVAIQKKCMSLNSKLTHLDSQFYESKERHNLSMLYVQFLHRLDLVDSWIDHKEIDLKINDLGEGKDISYIKTLINKQHGLEISIQVFQLEGMNPLIKEKESLVTSGHIQASAIQNRFSEMQKRWEKLKNISNSWNEKLQRSLDKSNKVDELFLLFAKKASAYCSWFESSEEDLVEPVICNSIVEIKILQDNYEQFKSSLGWAQSELKQLLALDRQIKSFTNFINPYTWHTMDSLQEIWNNLQSLLQQRQSDIKMEQIRQEKNDKLRRIFAEKANSFSLWLFDVRRSMVESSGQLQTQLQFLQSKLESVSQKKAELVEIEQLAIDFQDGMIWHNNYTEHTPVSLNQQLDQILQLGRRMIHNMQQQIIDRSTPGVKDDDLKVFQSTFTYYDKDNSGQLEEKEFKSCLRSLGYSLSVLDEGQRDPDYEKILDQVDLNRVGYITLSQFMSFMISRSTENVKSCEELEDAFKAITSDRNKSYVMEDELRQAVGIELKEFCMERMRPISSSKPSALDYKLFTHSLFLP